MKKKSNIDGSSSCIQIASDTNPKQVDAFINEFNRTIEELDLKAFCELPEKFPFVGEAGEDPFFDEIKEKIERNLEEGKTCLEKSDGFCHNCLKNEPVKIYGSGSSKIGVYYYFDSFAPIEIHSCTFCVENKDEEIEETMAENFTRMFSSLERDPAIVETVIKLGTLMKDSRLFESISLFHREVSLEEISFDKSNEGEKEVLSALLNFEKYIKETNAELKPQLIFYGINEGSHEDIHSYHGLPGLVVNFDSNFLVWLVPSADKKIYDMTSFVLTKEQIENSNEISLTNYYL